MKIAISTDVQRLAVESFRTFLASEVAPVARLFEGRSMPAQKMRELTQGIAEFGLPGASIAQTLGGMGLSAVTEALLFEELSALSSVIAECVLGNLLVASALANLPPGRDALRKRYLPDLLAGRSFGGFFLEQAEGVSAWPTDDGWVINGNHQWVCNGQCADVLITPLPGEEGVCCYVVVEREQHGYVSRNDASHPAQVTFSTVRLPADLSDAQKRSIAQVLTGISVQG
ncbi:MAG: acyl-CoA dehydrogenase family protein [Pseudomonas sp.]